MQTLTYSFISLQTAVITVSYFGRFLWLKYNRPLGLPLLGHYHYELCIVSCFCLVFNSLNALSVCFSVQLNWTELNWTELNWTELSINQSINWQYTTTHTLYYFFITLEKYEQYTQVQVTKCRFKLNWENDKRLVTSCSSKFLISFNQ